MAEKRKVLFNYGQSKEYQLIITDAPVEAIKNWCSLYVKDRKNGVRNEMFYSLKAQYYVMELLDSVTESDKEALELIGYDEVYDYMCFDMDKSGNKQKTVYLGTLNKPTVEEVIEILEKYKGKGKKISIMGVHYFDVFSSGDYITFDEQDLTQEYDYMTGAIFSESDGI